MIIDAKYIERKLYHKVVTPSDTAIPNFYPKNWFECDMCRVTRAMFFYEYEIKITRSDFKADFRKGEVRCIRTGDTSPDYYKKHYKLEHGDPYGPSNFFFVVPEGLVELDEVPDHAGLIYVSESSFSIIKKAPRLHKEKVSREFLLKMNSSFCFRYWSERLK